MGTAIYHPAGVDHEFDIRSQRLPRCRHKGNIPFSILAEYAPAKFHRSKAARKVKITRPLHRIYVRPEQCRGVRPHLVTISAPEQLMHRPPDGFSYDVVTSDVEPR